jgi:hypothetical protein
MREDKHSDRILKTLLKSNYVKSRMATAQDFPIRLALLNVTFAEPQLLKPCSTRTRLTGLSQCILGDNFGGIHRWQCTGVQAIVTPGAADIVDQRRDFACAWWAGGLGWWKRRRGQMDARAVDIGQYTKRSNILNWRCITYRMVVETDTERGFRLVLVNPVFRDKLWSTKRGYKMLESGA